MYIFYKLNEFFLTILEKTEATKSREKLRLMHFLWLSSLGTFLGATFLPYSLFFQSAYMKAVVLMLTIVMSSSIYFLYKGVKPYIVFNSTMFLLLVMLILFIIYPVDVSSRILWCYLYPISCIFLFGYKVGIRWSLGMLLSIFLAIFFIKELEAKILEPFWIRFIITYLTIVCMVSWIEFYKNRFQQDLEYEIQKRRELEEKLIHLANTDELTGLLNRRYFWKEARKEFKRAKRYNYSLSLALLDIDYFKSINDTYGHLIGDNVLKVVADFCKQFLRSSDFVARVGGEEFAFILVNVTPDEAKLKFEKLKNDIAQLLIETDDTKLNITVSIGVSTLSLDKENNSLENLYKQADEALYKAKETGRNKVIIHTS